MIGFFRRLFPVRRRLARDPAIDHLIAEMRQSSQQAKLAEYLIRRERERTGNPIEETVFPPHRWNGEPT